MVYLLRVSGKIGDGFFFLLDQGWLSLDLVIGTPLFAALTALI
jgi:hypothetical protein